MERKIFTQVNGKKIELPKYTLEVIDMIDNLINTENKYRNGLIAARECMINEYDFLKKLLGEDTVNSVFGKDLQSMDMTIMIGGVYQIIRRYSMEVEAEKMGKQSMNRQQRRSLAKAKNRQNRYNC